MKEKSRGTCEGTGWATRLRKRGKKRRVDGCVSVLGGLYTRLRKSGRRFERGRVRVLGGLLG